MRTKDIHQLKKSHVSYNSEGFSLYSIDQTGRCHELFMDREETKWVYDLMTRYFEFSDEAKLDAEILPVFGPWGDVIN